MPRDTLSGVRAAFRDDCYLPRFKESHRHDLAFDLDRFQLDMFHEQVPLPVPCYDLLPVTEFTVVLREAGLRVPPAPLS
jgi:hypothetical protein